MKQPVTLKPGKKIRLEKFDPAYTSGFKSKEDVADETARNERALAELSYRLYGESRRALLIILQGLDTSGKDGTVRHVMHAVSPQSCQVATFKRPTDAELAHDFLWRVHRAAPPHGFIGIFNRSHYEDVLVTRVHKLVSKKTCKARYEQINAFERLLADSGTTILKFFLHISNRQQLKRLKERLDDPGKRWKFNPDDLKERRCWNDYQAAYDDALTHSNTEHAPWHIVPADHKWHRDWLVSRTVRRTLERMNPRFPPANPELGKVKLR